MNALYTVQAYWDFLRQKPFDEDSDVLVIGEVQADKTVKWHVPEESNPKRRRRYVD